MQSGASGGLHPVFTVKIGSFLMQKLKSEVVDIAVRASMDSAPGSFETTVKLGEGGAGFDKNDPVVVSLGYQGNGEPTVVFTGKVDSISTTGPKVMVMSPLTKLYNLKRAGRYDGKSAKYIVEDLAKQAQVQVDIIEEGIKFPSFVVDEHKSYFEHMKVLADRCGFDLYASSEGKLIFKKYRMSEAQAHEIRYGRNIIEIQLVEKKPAADSVQVAGSSPAGSKGEDKHHWMTKAEVGGEAGSGENQELIQDMSIKDPNTAKAVADATLERLQAGWTINIKIPGNAIIMLGHKVNIQGVPNEALNGEFQVREIEHVFTTSEGFTTTLTCRGAPPK
jgi:phage protein D